MIIEYENIILTFVVPHFFLIGGKLRGNYISFTPFYKNYFL